jgi:uncharacterized membrane protein YGL010W
MSTLEQKLSDYAAYHRDARNVTAHMLGIPLIVFAVEILLSRPVFTPGGVPLTPAMLASVLAAIYYFTLDTGFGAALAVLLALASWAGLALARLPTPEWAVIGVGTFVIGWIIQFIGHAFEGRKPAFLDDLVSLLIGPLFITAEFGFLLGLRLPLQVAIEESLKAAIEEPHAPGI